MSIFLLSLAVGVVLLLPALAAVRRVRLVVPGLGGAAAVALLYSGVGIAAWILWLGARFVGFTPWVLVAVSLLVAGFLASGTGAVSSGAAASPPGGDPVARGSDGTDGTEGTEGPEGPGHAADSRRTDGTGDARASRPAAAPGDGGDPLAALLLIGALLAILVLAPFWTFGQERADGVHRMAMTDWYKHLVVTTAVDTSGSFPPANPFLQTDGGPTYYFGFHLLAASLDRVAGLPGRLLGEESPAADPAGDPADDPAGGPAGDPDDATGREPGTTRGGGAGPGDGDPGGPLDVYHVLLLLTVLTAVALPFVLYLVARDLGSRREAVLAAGGGALLAGFDLVVMGVDTLRAIAAGWPLPGGLAGLRAAVPSTHLDYWIHHNERQFNAAYVTTAWAPQHTAGVLLALLAWWLLSPHGDRADRPRSGPLLPALLLAGLPAVSAYVALGLALGLAGVAAAQSWERHCAPWSTPVVRRWWRAGLVALVLALPILSTLAAGTGSSAGVVLAVSDAGTWTNGAVFSWLLGESWWARLLDTPAVYLFEFGIVGLLALLEIRTMGGERRGAGAPGRRPARRRAGHPGVPSPVLARETVVAVATILVAVAVLRPPLGGPNNLYARPALLAFLLLTPFAARRAARYLGEGPPYWLLAGVAVCGLGTVFALAGTVLEGSLFWAQDPDLVASSRWINRETPDDVLVAVDPDEYESGFGYFLRRRLLVADERHARLLGATPLQFEATAAALDSAYSTAAPEAAAARFDELGAAVVVVRGGAGARWARSACFAQGYAGDAWSVLVRVPGSCSAPESR